MNEFYKYGQAQLVTFITGCSVCVLGMMILLHFDSKETTEDSSFKYAQFDDFAIPNETESTKTIQSLNSSQRIRTMPRGSVHE